MKAKVKDELKQHFRPEFLNRIDDTIVFHQLSTDEIIEIVDLMLNRVDAQLRNKDMGIELTPRRQGAARRAGLRPGARCAAAAPDDPARDRGRAVREDPLRRAHARARSWWSTPPTAGRDGRKVFTFRGEAKPADLPDVPPVAVEAAALAVDGRIENVGPVPSTAPPTVEPPD